MSLPRLFVENLPRASNLESLLGTAIRFHFWHIVLIIEINISQPKGRKPFDLEAEGPNHGPEFGISPKFLSFTWWDRWGSNPRPRRYEHPALTAELQSLLK